MSALRKALIGVALLIAGSAPVRAADAMMPLDDYNIRRAIILQCHMTQSPADIAFLAREDAVRRTALVQLRAQLDASDPAHRAENAKKADDMLQSRRAARDYDISEQVRNYGCPWLEGKL
ncbi:MAG: hypothetical protein QOF03_1114 [Alphaproteobacteria bacterium]|jgi:hypothetical protein|nr:hypothetical protein [Alphaproteobacteria bacterium]